MREGLIDDLKKRVQILIFFGEENSENVSLMSEAIEALEEYQKLQFAKSETLYICGNNPKGLVDDLNKKRAEKGLPPL